MADGTGIEWTDATWNPITGCMVKSPGCINCYAMTLAGTRLRNHPSRAGLTREVNGHHVWTGEVRFNEEWLDQPIRWTRPRDIFVVAHGDLAYEKVPDEWIGKIFHVMRMTEQHRFKVLTKRPDRLARFLARSIQTYSNVWIGTSVERQQEATERVGHLATIAAMGWNTWVSFEPALGPVDWSGWEFIRWMVSGGESGPDSRPTHPDWHRATRDWCAANSIPYFFKQWGSWLPGENNGVLLAQWQDGTEGSHIHEKAEWRHFGTPGDLGAFALRIGKKAAGASLDGREHKARADG
jgi:protein gp37